MNDEILIINEYPIGWGWLKDVPLPFISFTLENIKYNLFID